MMRKTLTTTYPSSEMSKTKKKQPNWMREDDRWLRKGGGHSGPSRRKQKQEILFDMYEDYEDGISDHRRR